jgi:hypothetical protein
MIEKLRDAAAKANAVPAWFGLGFVQLKLTHQTRVHFWHPECTKDIPPEEIHDHRYDFTSKVLFGELVHNVYGFEYNTRGKFEMFEESCEPGKRVDPLPIFRGDIVQLGSYTLTAGSSYTFKKDQFHNNESRKAVTFLTRGEVEKDFAHVIRPRNGIRVCPFSVQKSPAECWSIIEDLTKGLDFELPED